MKMAQPPPPPPEEAEAPGCVVKEIEKQLYKTLKDVFKYDSYRTLVQKRAVEAVANSSQDVFVSMPTGAGKSLCYQLPALVSERRGITIVVSPLIALMQDQIQQMTDLGIPTETINSKMVAAERDRVKKDLMSNNPKTKLLYITPELASTSGFYSMMDHFFKTNNIARIAVDEAHCVSQWGHNFRPDYLRLGELRVKYPSVPWVALTATASVQVMDDILALLKLYQPVAIFKTSCFRPNLYYDVVFKEVFDDPLADLVQFALSALGEHWEMSPPAERGCGIVYCRTRDGCEDLAKKLTKLGLLTQPYHAGIKPSLRQETQSNWMDGRLPVIAATVSFGMGIDKPSVRFVAHWCVSQSVAGYYQESGRAGRDGKQAKCRIYYSRKDRDTILFLLKKDETSAKAKSARLKISATIKSFNTMIKYCEEAVCRHYMLAREFGDDMPDCRKHCDVCCTPKVVAQKLSSFKSLFLGSKLKYFKHSHDDGELYGGGRAAIQQEYDEYKAEDRASREKEASVALSNLISDEFSKRRGAKEKSEKYVRTSSSKVLQPALKKIPEVSVPMREKYFDKLVHELNHHLKACSSKRQCPSLNEKDIQQCAAEVEWNSFSSKGNIHMYRREIVNLTKSLREASRQVEVHPVVTKFVPSHDKPGNLKSVTKEKLHTIIDYFSKQKTNSENRMENSNLNSSLSYSDSQKTGYGSDASQPEEPRKRIRTSSDSLCGDSNSVKLKSFSASHGSESESSEKTSPNKLAKPKKSSLSETSRTSIEDEKPIMKYFFESVCPINETMHLSPEEAKSSSASIASPCKTAEKQHSSESVKRPLANSLSKSKRKRSSDSSDRTHSSEKSSQRSDKNINTYQIRNDNLKKAADLVRKHLNPEYKSKRISKDFFKIVCRSISHRLVEADAVNDTAAKHEVEKLLQSHISASTSH